MKWTKKDVIEAFQTGRSPFDQNMNGIPDAQEIMAQLMAEAQQPNVDVDMVDGQ